jgi:hypothetical protein
MAGVQGWQVLDKRVEEQLRALGRELARAAQVFAAGMLTTAEASKVEAQVEPLRRQLPRLIRRQGAKAADNGGCAPAI